MNKESGGYPKPFLRWAGGKTWLIKHLGNIRLASYNNYHEAFLGGGSTFFYLNPKHNSFLSDLNADLIETYQQIRDNLSGVLKELRLYNNSEDFYYELRSKQLDEPAARAAKFIFLNQTSYNGIYRVNLKGIYNVPYGFRSKSFLDEANLRKVQLALKNATLLQQDFSGVMDNIKTGDLVFLDPPYTVSHNDNGFIKYNEKIFSLEDQVRLSALIDKIKSRDAYYILTNAAHKTIEEIFEKGDKRYEFERASLIGGRKATRGHTTEFIFSNINL